jgi:cephalosporin hydroxylase
MNILRNFFDNSTHSSDKWEPYFDVYHRHLQHFRGQPVTLVEVGVQKGGSLEMWSNYLGPQARIIGIDVDPECANLKYEQSNIEVIIGDQASPEFWTETLSKIGNIDIFIDDGGHTMDQQIVTLESVFPKLNMNGVFICEDCHTSYMSGFGGGLGSKNSFMEYCKSIIDIQHRRWHNTFITELDRKSSFVKELTSMHVYDSVVVLEKFGERNMQRVFPKL